MKSRFQMSMMGELTFFLRLQVRQTPQGIFINQSKYAHDILKRFDFTGPKSASTPMSTSFQLDADLSGNPVDQNIYRAIIGSLLYLTASRPDNMFAMCVCASFQCDPRESHLGAVKRILKYLKGTPNFGLWYPKDSGFELTTFTDSDHALNRKSTSGACQFLGDKLVSWSSRKQNCVSLSKAEAEYVAAACCCSQVLWMKIQPVDYGYTMHRIPIYCDSSSSIQIAANPVQHSRMKHIDIRYHFIKDHIEKGNVELFFVESERQIADLFTKAFDEKCHYYLLICGTEVRLLNTYVQDPMIIYTNSDHLYQNSCRIRSREYPAGVDNRLQLSLSNFQTLIVFLSQLLKNTKNDPNDPSLPGFPKRSLSLRSTIRLLPYVPGSSNKRRFMIGLKPKSFEYNPKPIIPWIGVSRQMANQQDHPTSPIDPEANRALIAPAAILPILQNNEYVNLTTIQVQHTIVREILRAHPLAYAMTATAEVPAIYIQQFWNTAVLDHRFGVRVDETELVVSMEDIGRILHLPAATDDGHKEFDSLVSGSILFSEILALAVTEQINGVSQVSTSMLPPDLSGRRCST
ncbi:LOW QUALITY PROTEIN: hypothetical protein OSB04_028559 [Centaurea solstitialis]|uniref:Uncharacterized protein n=1 Tax=Centaurea solstitialis TaxID=347529 RepID=A0AA38SGQ4_9ASTR|nr:LOW QUALITY PROTEIN: hypothetical protein OSB04_028559 [Centaurea solstitialis]